MNDFKVRYHLPISCRTGFPEFFIDLPDEKFGGLRNKAMQHIF